MSDTCADAVTSIDAIASMVRRARRDLRRYAASDGTVTLMCSDVEGFAEMAERLGERAAAAVIAARNAIVGKQIGAHGGFEVELHGDGVLLAFANARQAVWCAIAVQRALAAYNAEHVEAPIRARIGLHRGAPSATHGAVENTVVVTARVAARARGGEILISEALRKALDDVGNLMRLAGGGLRYGATWAVRLRGVQGRSTLYPVIWGGGDP